MSSRVKKNQRKKEQRTLCLHGPNRTSAALQSITELVQQPLAGGKTLLACGHFNLRFTHFTWENKRQPSRVSVASSGLASSEEWVQVQQRERTSDKKKKLFTSLFRRGLDLQTMEGRNPHFPASIHLTSFLSFTRSPLNANSLPATHPHSNPHSSPLFYSFLYLYFSNPSSLSQKQLVHPLISHQVWMRWWNEVENAKAEP